MVMEWLSSEFNCIPFIAIDMHCSNCCNMPLRGCLITTLRGHADNEGLWTIGLFHVVKVYMIFQIDEVSWETLLMMPSAHSARQMPQTEDRFKGGL